MISTCKINRWLSLILLILLILNGSYGDPNDRMNWIDTEVLPVAKQWLLDHPNGIEVRKLLSGEYEQ